MKKEIIIGGGNCLPCLHCGEMVNLEKDTHLCNAPKNQFLNKSDLIIMQMPNGDLFDIKNKVILKSLKI